VLTLRKRQRMTAVRPHPNAGKGKPGVLFRGPETWGTLTKVTLE
jgi:hypothetical protein